MYLWVLLERLGLGGGRGRGRPDKLDDGRRLREVDIGAGDPRESGRASRETLKGLGALNIIRDVDSFDVLFLRSLLSQHQQMIDGSLN